MGTAVNKQSLLSELRQRTMAVKTQVASYNQLSESALNAKPAPDKWSLAEVLEHLNITNGIYLRLIMEKINTAAKANTETYKSHWLGDFLYNKISPHPDGSISKMKTPGFLQPQSSTLKGSEVVKRFLEQQDQFLDILDRCAGLDIQKIKVPLSFTNMLKLRLGDNLRFLIAHNERHMLQASRVVKFLEENRREYRV